jgi:hypothetical protein
LAVVVVERDRRAELSLSVSRLLGVVCVCKCGCALRPPTLLLLLLLITEGNTLAPTDESHAAYIHYPCTAVILLGTSDA